MDDDSELSPEIRSWIAAETGAIHVVLSAEVPADPRRIRGGHPSVPTESLKRFGSAWTWATDH